MITISIRTGNSAFEEDQGYEIARILRDLADKFEQGRTPSSANDINGNKVVKIEYED